MNVDLRQLLGAQGQPVGGRSHRKPPYFKTKKVAILGCTANLEFAPWHDPTWTLVSHCSARQFCKREPDWYFDLHRPECFEAKKSWNLEYYNWLVSLQTPIFMQEDSKGPWRKIPLAVRYPIERIRSEFRSFFTNHAAYMIALAMTEGVTHIGLFGCQYAGEEYGVQRDSLTYWLGRFEQYGGTLVIPPKWNTLLSVPKGLYGYESHDDEGKLTAEYRPKAAPPQKAVVMAAAPAGEVPLMADPDGEPPDTERAQRLYGALALVGP